MSNRRRKPLSPSMGMPWTPAEDDKLRQMNAVGLTVDAWAANLPTRTLGEALERRLDLGIKPAPLL